MKQYKDAVNRILYEGDKINNDRTGVGTIFKSSEYMKFDLREGFPLLTTRYISFDFVVEELLWFLSGSTNYKDLPEKWQHLWSEWADDDGSLGDIYGKQLRHYTDISINQDDQVINVNYRDQLQECINGIKNNPYSRRHVISLWNPNEIASAKLPPCHGTVIQFNVTEQGDLDCTMFQRSADYLIGVPYNIAQYALLTHIISKVTNLNPRYLTLITGNSHVYLNHVETYLSKQYNNEPLELPTLVLNDIESIDDFSKEDVKLVGYDYTKRVKYALNV